MGAGIYYFTAPAGENWSKTVFVDLSPTFWDTEETRRKQEFREYLEATPDAASFLVDPHTGDRCVGCETSAFESWMEEAYPGESTEEDFRERIREDQLERTIDALEEAFPGTTFTLDERPGVRKVGNAVVLGEVGRMVIATSYSYDGSDIALVVTPRVDLQDPIWSIEANLFKYEHGWYRHTHKEMLAENARLQGVYRSVKSGALHREMERTFAKLVEALHEEGLAQDMWFRRCAWTGTHYPRTELHELTCKRLARRRSGRGQVQPATAQADVLTTAH